MSRRTVSPARCGPVVLLALCGLSCSGSGDAALNPVEGKVLYKDQPLAGALVTFHPKGPDNPNVVRPLALTREDGTFTVMTGEKPGAPAGEYVITVICSQVPPEAKKGVSTGGMEAQDRLKGAYADRAASKITVEVKNGANQLEPFRLN